MHEVTKEQKITPEPMTPMAVLERYFLPNPLIKNPTSGKSGTKKAILLILIFQSVQKVNVYGMGISIHHNDNR